jgi:methyltransferase (TIGR00027 family)
VDTDEARPSRTARSVALFRAAHQILDRPLLFEDPLALRIVGATEDELRAEDDPARRGRRCYFAMRSRFAEDALKMAVARGVRQYAVLGAGLDTYAYRNPYPDLSVFEVDQPATQSWKRHRLARAEIAIPDSVRFVPVDFEQVTLVEGLAAAGFDPGVPTFFSWLGVTPYLTRDAIFTTLGFVGGLSGEIVFDYGESPDAIQKPELRAAYEAIARRAAEMGEPWITYFEPAGLHADLARLGFREIQDLGPTEIAMTYFGAPPGTVLGGGGHVLRARS